MIVLNPLSWYLGLRSSSAKAFWRLFLKSGAGKTAPMLQKTIRQLGGDDLLEGILRRLPEGYHYVPDHLSDEDIWYEALKEKYEL